MGNPIVNLPFGDGLQNPFFGVLGTIVFIGFTLYLFINITKKKSRIILHIVHISSMYFVVYIIYLSILHRSYYPSIVSNIMFHLFCYYHRMSFIYIYEKDQKKIMCIDTDIYICVIYICVLYCSMYDNLCVDTCLYIYVYIYICVGVVSPQPHQKMARYVYGPFASFSQFAMESHGLFSSMINIF